MKNTCKRGYLHNNLIGFPEDTGLKHNNSGRHYLIGESPSSEKAVARLLQYVDEYLHFVAVAKCLL